MTPDEEAGAIPWEQVKKDLGLTSLNEKALEAAVLAVAKLYGDDGRIAIEDSDLWRDTRAAISAYLRADGAVTELEHRGDCTKESFTCLLCEAFNDGEAYALSRLTGAIEGDVGELVEGLRIYAKHSDSIGDAAFHNRAADALLSQQREIERMRAIIKATDQFARDQQLAFAKPKPFGLP